MFNKPVEVLKVNDDYSDKPYITVRFTEGKFANTIDDCDLELKNAIDSGELLL